MIKHSVAALLVGSLLVLQLPAQAVAENQMGYSMLSAGEAAQLPRGGGALGLDVRRGQQITDSGLTFELVKVNAVGRGSAGAQAGFKAGDQIIAVDGKVFPSIKAFAAYVGSMAPGRQASFDYIPSGGGPQQAQRVGVTLGAAGRAAPSSNGPSGSTGLSTGTKIAIGVGAAALFGCYKFGCFNHKSGTIQQPAAAQPQQ